jgi:hypothetical protein
MPAMTLVIVARSKMSTFARLRDLFAGEPDVQVIWDRRTTQRRQRQEHHEPERRVRDRRAPGDPFNGRDFIVVHVDAGQAAAQKPLPVTADRRRDLLR